VRPRLIHSIGDAVQPAGDQAPALGFAPEHIAFIQSAMAAVVQVGTAAHVTKLNLGPVTLAGKTGTAQSHSYGAAGEKTKNQKWAQRDHAWFIAFAPADSPRYAMSVLVEHGGMGGDAAAPKAVEIMRVALLKDPAVRARIVQAAPATDAPSGLPANVAAPT
jgi:penicillin-binding protein 2